jgi:acylphosphatase
MFLLLVMVDKVFYIKGDKIFDVGLRFSLVGLGGDYNIKVQAVNDRTDQRVKVVASGSSQNISSFYDYVQRNDIRFFKDENSKYAVTDIENYSGPKIDFSNYQNSLNIEQIGKMLYTAGNKLPNIETKIDSIDKNVISMNKSVEGMTESLRSIDKKFPSQEKPE